MSYTGDVEHLEELEPLDDGPGSGEGVASDGQQPAVGQVAMPVAITGGMPAPAYNPSADQEYYKFLFAGIVMLLGCLMPFGPQLEMVGYKTLRGAVFLLIALGVVWSSWASIHNRRMIKGMLRWVLLAAVPLILGIFDILVAFNPGTAVADWITKQNGQIKSWGDFFGGLGNVLTPGDQVGEFVRAYGPGRLVVFGGAVLAELFMVQAIFGGAKKMKEQKAERRASPGARKRK